MLSSRPSEATWSSTREQRGLTPGLGIVPPPSLTGRRRVCRTVTPVSAASGKGTFMEMAAGSVRYLELEELKGKEIVLGKDEPVEAALERLLVNYEPFKGLKSALMATVNPTLAKQASISPPQCPPLPLDLLHSLISYLDTAAIVNLSAVSPSLRHFARMNDCRFFYPCVHNRPLKAPTMHAEREGRRGMSPNGVGEAAWKGDGALQKWGSVTLKFRTRANLLKEADKATKETLLHLGIPDVDANPLAMSSAAVCSWDQLRDIPNQVKQHSAYLLLFMRQSADSTNAHKPRRRSVKCKRPSPHQHTPHHQQHQPQQASPCGSPSHAGGAGNRFVISELCLTNWPRAWSLYESPEQTEEICSWGTSRHWGSPEL
ncbi:unnamed protein product [Vitrella brassicaformis CCMP3155]|uniref:F-box domain-containing protein n=1 Tax=Vitrella brassicaformis (strain CCMP3155) TaxID=1169540 RepID=A0A0G4H2Z7_VITBC|nr:unnamed protein product [Vitrella brassicaformis CCMP3155]|eukprot:CEM37957.1 unnamed protein product [Vitrella brassicaformis CCMP3155]